MDARRAGRIGGRRCAANHGLNASVREAEELNQAAIAAGGVATVDGNGLTAEEGGAIRS